MEMNLIGELKIMIELNIKPNFSNLAEEYGVDRHTVKKYFDNGGIPERKKVVRKSMWDPYYDEIVELMNKHGASKRNVYQYLLNKYGDCISGSYEGFKSYTLKHAIVARKATVPHPRYETDPGEQLQVDWKEDMIIHLKNGDEITFNVFSATLGYSREHVFIYSSTKTTQDFIRCIIETFRRLGGVTEKVLTDNMTAIVSVRDNNKRIYPIVSQLFKDLDCELKLCKVKMPQTKGKDENANKFVKWIYPYDGELESEDDLINAIENVICGQCNKQINTTTKLPPYTLFMKEKEKLKPFPRGIMLDNYIHEHVRRKVPATFLVEYKGSSYSVPPNYIGRYVDLYPLGDSIYIYANKEFVTKHNISQNVINYNRNHYVDGLSEILGGKDANIEQMAEKNLKRFENLGKHGK